MFSEEKLMKLRVSVLMGADKDWALLTPVLMGEVLYELRYYVGELPSGKITPKLIIVGLTMGSVSEKSNRTISSNKKPIVNININIHLGSVYSHLTTFLNFNFFFVMFIYLTKD